MNSSQNIRRKLFSAFFSLTSLIAVIAVTEANGQSGRIENIVEQAALVSEFDVNGLKVLVKRRESSPTVAAGLFFRGGSRNLTETTAGIEDFALRVATEAGKKYPRQTLRRELSKHGGSIGAGSNKDYSAISFASTRENFDTVWDMFTDVAINPAFAAEDVERVRRQLISGLRESEGSPDAALATAQERLLYSGHPYSNDPSGTIATISSFSVNDLRNYHRGRMHTSNLLLVVVGDVNADDIKARVTRSFGTLPKGSYKDLALPPLDFTKATVDVTPRNIGTNYVQGSFAAPSLKDNDYYAMKVATTILQQMVYEEVRIKRQLSYAPNAEMNSAAANTAFVYVTAVEANRAVGVIFDQIRFLRSNALADEAISGISGQFLTNYYIGQETNAAQAAELAKYELIGNGWRSSFEFLNRVREVKPADIQRVAQKYMNNLRFSVIGNPQSVDAAVFKDIRTAAN